MGREDIPRLRLDSMGLRQDDWVPWFQPEQPVEINAAQIIALIIVIIIALTLDKKPQ